MNTAEYAEDAEFGACHPEPAVAGEGSTSSIVPEKMSQWLIFLIQFQARIMGFC